MPEIGQTISHYQIIEKIGAGGMGEVYRARDVRLERDVAIKVLPPHLAEDAAALARFEREAKASFSRPAWVDTTINHLSRHPLSTGRLVRLFKALGQTSFKISQETAVGSLRTSTTEISCVVGCPVKTRNGIFPGWMGGSFLTCR